MENIYLRRLRYWAKKWGGSIEETGNLYWPSVQTAPFDDLFGVNFKKKIIYYRNDALEKRGQPYFIAGIIHEMGHVFASRLSVNKSKEYNFFGWEYNLARQIRFPIKEWRYGNRDYVIDEEYAHDVKQISDKDFRRFVKEIIARAMKHKLIVDSKCVAIR